MPVRVRRGLGRWPCRTVTTSHRHSAARQAQEALGLRLRELRKDAGLSARELAAATGQHYTRVSKLEHGVQSPTDDDIRRWCTACGADDQVPDLLATLRAVESAYLEFRRQARAGMKRVLGPHTVDRYADTSVFRIYEHNVIPGLFQTADYCAAMLSFWIDFLQTSNDLARRGGRADGTPTRALPARQTVRGGPGGAGAAHLVRRRPDPGRPTGPAAGRDVPADRVGRRSSR